MAILDPISPISILILGPPGSGKGTQGALLSRHYQVPHVSLGEILRSEAACGSPSGAEAGVYLTSGAPVPVSLMSRVLRDRLSRVDIHRGFVGDGLVRTIQQAHELDLILADIGMALNVVFYIDVPEVETIRRTSSRLVCGLCGAVYKVEDRPLWRAGMCDIDGGQLVARADDAAIIVKNRLRAHDESMAGIMDYYGTARLLYRIDGARQVSDVQASIAEICAVLL